MNASNKVMIFGLGDLGGMATAMIAEVKAAVADYMTDIHLDHLMAVDAQVGQATAAFFSARRPVRMYSSNSSRNFAM